MTTITSAGISSSIPAARPGALWITWERHRRTRELSEAFGAELVELRSESASPVRHLGLLWRTTACLVRRQPSVLLVQCPSLVLGVWAILLKRVFGYKVIADLHNEAVVPFIHTGRACRALLQVIRRGADVSLVSNDSLKAVIDDTGGRAMVLPDKIPALMPRPKLVQSRARARVVFVCTYAPDEPFRDVIVAAGQLQTTIELFVTGRPGSQLDGVAVPPNVRITGFLPDAEYERLLQGADVIVDLTAMNDCLVCGGYEAVALQTPLVTSDTRALREYFHAGTVYTAHDSAAMAGAIAFAVEHRVRLAAEMAALKEDLLRDWRVQREAVWALMNEGNR